MRERLVGVGHLDGVLALGHGLAFTAPLVFVLGVPLLGLILTQDLGPLFVMLYAASIFIGAAFAFAFFDRAGYRQWLGGAVSVLVAGILVGAGQRQGFVYGALVGMWAGVLDLLVQGLMGRPLTTVVALGLPMLQTTFGTLGGIIGSVIWRPLPTFTLSNHPGAAGPRKSTRKRHRYFSGPIAWLRVGAGIAAAVGGALWAHVILELVVQASEGRLLPETKLQAELVTWEITALVMVFGSAFAGAT